LFLFFFCIDLLLYIYINIINNIMILFSFLVNGAAELLNDLDITEVHEIGLGRVDDGEDGVDNQRSEESGVLMTNNLAVEGGTGRLNERVAVRELDWDGHGHEDLNGLGGCLVEVSSPAVESWDLESSTSILAAGWRTSILLCKLGV
jgi:hypothetical protein